MTTASTLVALAAATASAAPLPEKERPMDLKQLIGAYTFVSGEKDGAPIPAERLRDHVGMISEDRFVVSDRDKKELYAASYKVDTTQKGDHGGYAIAMTTTVGPDGAEGQRAAGLIKIDDQTVTLVYTYDGGPAPTEFKTKPDGKQNLFVLKKTDLGR